jgi:hypothetical protein
VDSRGSHLALGRLQLSQALLAANVNDERSGALYHSDELQLPQSSNWRVRGARVPASARALLPAKKAVPGMVVLRKSHSSQVDDYSGGSTYRATHETTHGAAHAATHEATHRTTLEAAYAAAYRTALDASHAKHYERRERFQL